MPMALGASAPNNGPLRARGALGAAQAAAEQRETG